MNTLPARLGMIALALGTMHAASARPAHAQIGVMGGANFETLADLQSGATLGAFQASSGYHVGLFATIGGGILGIRPSALYLNAGSLFQGASFLSVDGFDVSYVAVPIDLKIKPIPFFYIVGGPEFQFLLSSGAEADFQDDLESFVAKGGAGMGFQIGPAFLEGKFIFGLSSITTETYQVGTFLVTGADQVSNAVRVTMGIAF